jgi:hypothetical protein
MEVSAASFDEMRWLTERTRLPLTSDARAIKATGASGAIRGMVLFCNWTDTAVTAHVALDSPLAARALLEPAFHYAFETGGRKLALGFVSAANRRSLALARHIGFVETHRIRDGQCEGVDLVVLEYRKEAWLGRTQHGNGRKTGATSGLRRKQRLPGRGQPEGNG